MMINFNFIVEDEKLMFQQIQNIEEYEIDVFLNLIIIVNGLIIE